MIVAIPTNNTGRKSETPGRGQNATYAKYVDAAGYTPILVPMESDVEDIVNVSGALLLAGGIDVDPIYYGSSNYACMGTDPEKDAHERALFHAFRREGKPIFGICRGFQLIARELIANKYAEYGDYLDYVENISSHSQTGNLNLRRDIPSHMVRANIPSLFSTNEPNKLDLFPVNSMHHQALSVNFVRAALDFNAGMNLKPKDFSEEPTVLNIHDLELVAWSLRGVSQPKNSTKPDYENYWAVVEAMKIHNWGAPIMGVQWHPEELKDIRILRNFLEGAGNFLGEQGNEEVI